MGIFPVHRLQLHAHLEGVLLRGGGLLLGNTEEDKGQVRKLACVYQGCIVDSTKGSSEMLLLMICFLNVPDIMVLCSQGSFVDKKKSGEHGINDLIWLLNTHARFLREACFSESVELMSLLQVPCEKCERAPSQLH